MTAIIGIHFYSDNTYHDEPYDNHFLQENSWKNGIIKTLHQIGYTQLSEVPPRTTIHISSNYEYNQEGQWESLGWCIQESPQKGLKTVKIACEELAAELCDLAIIVGINPSDSGEELVILVLKRMINAVQDGNQIYAVIKGFNPPIEKVEEASNYGNWRQNYQQMGVDAKSLQSFHLTHSISESLSTLQKFAHFAGISNHSYPTFAIICPQLKIETKENFREIIQLARLALSLYYKIILRSYPLEEQIPQYIPFYHNNILRPWMKSRSNNRNGIVIKPDGFHVVLEEVENQKVYSVSKFPTELIVLSADSRDELIKMINETLSDFPTESLAEYAAVMAQQPFGSHRLAAIVTNKNHLKAKLEQAVKWLTTSTKTQLQTASGLFYGETISSKNLGRIAFLFPGQGSQYLNMLADLCIYIPLVRYYFEILNINTQTSPLPPTDFIFPPSVESTNEQKKQIEEYLFSLEGGGSAICTASIALFNLIKQFNISPDVMVGHSYGETAVLEASGMLKNPVEAFQMLEHLQEDISKNPHTLQISQGIMLTVRTSNPDVIEEVVEQFSGEIFIALDNCPHQVVLFGNKTNINLVKEKLKSMGAFCFELPFKQPVHTPLFSPQLSQIQELYNKIDLKPSDVDIYSCVTAAPFPKDFQSIREILASQWTKTVRFRETVDRLYAEGIRIFIEVGPSGKLTAFVKDTLQKKDFIAIASNREDRDGIVQLQELLSRLFIRGFNVNLEPLFDSRKLTVNPNKVFVNTTFKQESSTNGEESNYHAEIMNIHSELMEDFLESQDRILKLFKKNDC